MLESLIRLAMKQAWLVGSSDGHHCGANGWDCDSSCSDFPPGDLDILVDQFMAKNAPIFRESFRDAR